MSTPLHAHLQQLAASFADSVLAAIRSASLEELVAESGTPAAPRRGAPQGFRKAAPSVANRVSPAPAPKSSARLRRRTPEEIARTVDQVVSLVKKHRDGLRAEQIRVELGLQAKEMPRILKEGVAAKKLSSKGQKRATTYFAR